MECLFCIFLVYEIAKLKITMSVPVLYYKMITNIHNFILIQETTEKFLKKLML